MDLPQADSSTDSAATATACFSRLFMRSPWVCEAVSCYKVSLTGYDWFYELWDVFWGKLQVAIDINCIICTHFKNCL